jgi:hypothetical protein
VFIFGVVLLSGSVLGIMAMRVWATLDRYEDIGGKPPEQWRPWRYVPPRYLAMAVVGAVVGVALVVASGRSGA